MMDAAMQEMFKWILVWAGVLFMLFFIINFVLKGLLLALLRVKTSRGRLLLIRVVGYVDTYFKTGYVKEEELHFKNRERIAVALGMDRSLVYRFLGVNWVDVDEKTGRIINHVELSSYPGYSPEIQDSIVKRALYRPSLYDNKMKIILVIIILVLIVGLVNIFIGVKVLKAIQALGVIK